jgi:hypothetical protein
MEIRIKNLIWGHQLSKTINGIVSKLAGIVYKLTGVNDNGIKNFRDKTFEHEHSHWGQRPTHAEYECVTHMCSTSSHRPNKADVTDLQSSFTTQRRDKE